ncbi:MAG: TatD family hydrolase [Candidatus Helarchaeota archaeon]
MSYYHDSHCHLTQFKEVKNVIKDAIYKSVRKVVVVSMFKEENKKVLELYHQFPDVILPALGIHPITINSNSDIENLFGTVIKLIEQNLSIIKIIGEIGLDRYYTKDPNIWEKQKSIFNKFLSFSEKHKLGVTVHGKNAESEIMEILETYKISPIIIHWYSANEKLIKKGIDNGFFYSINFSVKYSKNVRNLVKLTPINRLLTESDGPVNYKKLNIIGKPSLIPTIIKDIVEIKNLQKDFVIENLQRNFEKIILKK